MGMKKLVWLTLAVFAVIVAVALFVTRSTLPQGIAINTKGQPTIGFEKAKVHIVAFEEPKCVNCRKFNDTVFPKIKKEFIDTNKVKYTIIPLSFLPGSMPAAIASLCVYYANPLYPNNDLFFTYYDYIYDHQPDEKSDWATTEKLLQFAHDASPAINLKKLRTCIDKESYRLKIVKNNDYARTIMGGTLMTPSIYVNGIEVDELSYDHISKLIKELLKENGVH